MAPTLDIVPAAEREKAERHEGVCQLLRDLLAEAEAGTVTGLLVVVERGTENMRYLSSGTEDRYALAGRVEALKLSLLGVAIDPASQ